MTTVYRHAFLWPGRGDEILAGVDVAVEDGRITSVGSLPRYPEGATVVDLDGRWLMPGLIDMHVHLVWSGSGDPATTLEHEGEHLTAIRSVANAATQLHAGITTVRDLGGNWDLAITLARAVSAGLAEGPSIVAAGQTVIMTGGHDPFWGVMADGPTAVVAAVRRQVAAGAGVIKVAATGGVYGRADGEEIGQSEFTYEELAAAAGETHRFGLKVAAHALGNTGIRNAVRAGIDTIEHGNFLDEEIVREMQRRDTALCPTLQIYRTIADHTAGLIPSYAVEKARRAVVAHRESFEMARRAGIPIVAGTDAGSCATPHPALVAELQVMRQYGMGAGETLAAATSKAAEVLGRGDCIGTIEPGKAADLLILEANPLEDIRHLLRVWGVVRQGRLRTRRPDASAVVTAT
jgi:imidazolonepropionase-like amidohydrolase